MLQKFRTSLEFDRRVWLLLLAMLAFRFGQGLFYPFSAIHFHNVVGIPLSLVGVGLAAELAPVRLRGTYLALFGTCFGAAYGVSPVIAGALLEARMPHVIWIIQLAAAGLAAIGLVALKAISRQPKKSR